ncbi:hypothetical protein Tco_1389330 [Tanacetum coccineum]
MVSEPKVQNLGKTCVSGRFARLQEVRFNFDQKDQETPRIVGDDSARSEPTEVADSNNFKPLLKEKRLKEQTLTPNVIGGIKLCWNVVVEKDKKRIRGTKKGKEYSRKRFGVEIVSGRHKNNNNESRNKEVFVSV